MVHLKGTPHPEIRWKRDNRDLVETKNVRTVTEPREAWVNIKEASRHETGLYTVEAKNVAGIKTADIKVRVLACPGPTKALAIGTDCVWSINANLGQGGCGLVIERLSI